MIRNSSMRGVLQSSPSKQPKMPENMPLISTDASFRAQSLRISSGSRIGCSLIGLALSCGIGVGPF